MKVKNKEFKYMPNKAFYTPIDGKLTFVKPIKTFFSNADNILEYFVKLPDGTKKCLPENMKAYMSEKDYREAKEMSFGTTSYVNMARNRGINIKKVEDYCSPTVWEMKDGEPIETEVDVTITMECGVGCKVKVYRDGEVVEEITNWYSSREECLAFNEYKVVEEDGTEHTVVGEMKRLSLTKEQEKLIEKLKDAIKAVKDANIRVIWDSENELLLPININDAEDITDCDADLDGYFFVGNEYVSNLPSFKIHDYWSNCDYGIQIKFK